LWYMDIYLAFARSLHDLCMIFTCFGICSQDSLLFCLDRVQKRVYTVFKKCCEQQVQEESDRMVRKELVKARLFAGLSQEKVAEHIGVTRNTISQWERGVQDPYPVYVHSLCKLFGKSPQELEIDSRWKKLDQLEGVETQQDGSADAPSLSVVPSHMPHREDLFNSDDLYERVRYALRKPSVVDDIALEHLESVTHDCWKMMPVVGGVVSHHSRKYVLDRLNTVTRLLEGSQPILIHEQLCSIAGKLSLIIANISSNIRDYKTAKIYYEIAIEAAQEARNIPLQAVSLVRLSFNSTRADRPDESLPLVQEANYLVTHCGQHATITTRSWIAAALAEVFANLKNAKACFEALAQSELQVPYPAVEEDPYYTTFSTFLLAGYKGTCYVLLRQPKNAEKVLGEALKQLPVSSTYQKGYILSDLAQSYIQQGKLEEMYDCANNALAIAVQTNAPEIFLRVCKLRNDFGEWASTLHVKNLETQIHYLEPQFYNRTE
jgi:transcriptional regulator with XRE-family HTH domain